MYAARGKTYTKAAKCENKMPQTKTKATLVCFYRHKRDGLYFTHTKRKTQNMKHNPTWKLPMDTENIFNKGLFDENPIDESNLHMILSVPTITTLKRLSILECLGNFTQRKLKTDVFLSYVTCMWSSKFCETKIQANFKTWTNLYEQQLMNYVAYCNDLQYFNA